MPTDLRRSIDAALGDAAGDWRLGLAGGLVGGIAAGTLLTLTDPDLLAITVPAIYGLTPPPDMLLGWIFHLLHATVFGVGFAAVVVRFDLAGTSARTQLAAATVYALVGWLALTALALPAWLAVLDTTASLPFPYVTSSALAAHVTYGFTLGTVYYVFDDPRTS